MVQAALLISILSFGVTTALSVLPEKEWIKKLFPWLWPDQDTATPDLELGATDSTRLMVLEELVDGLVQDRLGRLESGGIANPSDSSLYPPPNLPVMTDAEMQHGG